MFAHINVQFEEKFKFGPLFCPLKNLFVSLVIFYIPSKRCRNISIFINFSWAIIMPTPRRKVSKDSSTEPESKRQKFDQTRKTRKSRKSPPLLIQRFSMSNPILQGRIHSESLLSWLKSLTWIFNPSIPRPSSILQPLNCFKKSRSFPRVFFSDFRILKNFALLPSSFGLHILFINVERLQHARSSAWVCVQVHRQQDALWIGRISWDLAWSS